jgi:hypothetical protein
MNKERKRRSGNYTSNPMSSDDLLSLGSSSDYTPPPRADLHPKIGKQRMVSILLHIKVRVIC